MASSEIICSLGDCHLLPLQQKQNYCCPVSWLGLLSLSSLWKSCPRNLQKLQKSRPRNSRDDSPLPALLSLWHVFPRFAAIFWFLRQHYQIFTPRVIELGFLSWHGGRSLSRPGASICQASWLHLFANLIPAKTRHPSHPIRATRRATIWHPKLLLAHLIISHRFLLLLSFVLNLLPLKGSNWHRHRQPHLKLIHLVYAKCHTSDIMPHQPFSHNSSQLWIVC